MRLPLAPLKKMRLIMLTKMTLEVAMTNFRSHPLAKLVPLMADDALNALVKDIRVNGLRQPIFLYEGMVLEGLDRLRACERAGVKPRFKKFKGSEHDAVAFVGIQYLTGRQSTIAQKAALGVFLLPQEKALARTRMLAGKSNHPQRVVEGKIKRKLGEATVIAARRVGVSCETVRQAAHIAQTAPDVFEAMVTGLFSTFADARRLALLPIEQRTEAFAAMKTGKSASDAILAASKAGKLPSLKNPAQEWVIIDRTDRLLKQLEDVPKSFRRRCLAFMMKMVEAEIIRLDSEGETTAPQTDHLSELDTAALEDILDCPTVEVPTEKQDGVPVSRPDEVPMPDDLNISDLFDSPTDVPPGTQHADENSCDEDDSAYEYYPPRDFALEVELAALNFHVPFKSTDIARKIRCSHQKVSAILKQLGWPHMQKAYLRDGCRGPRWLPQTFDSDARHAKIRDVILWTEIHADEKDDIWEAWGWQVD